MNTINIQRRLLLTSTAVIAFASTGLVLAQRPRLIEVWKDPSCGCCKDWIAHIEKSGFKATVKESGSNAARAGLGMPQKFASCHTALIQGYVIEGHVPASDIQRLLKDKPKALGLAVPGMRVGSPGMDGPAYGGRHDRYEVLLVLKDGNSKVFNTYS
jgi:hypothetical protein